MSSARRYLKWRRSSSRVLRAFELDPAAIQARTSIDEDITALLDGRLDAIFILGTQPSSSVQKAIAGGAQLLPLHSGGRSRAD
jgi:hypothetical protein